jgi:glycosyltransferase involved in cell wall biosynthesis
MEQTIVPAGIEDTLLHVEQSDYSGWESPRGDDSYRSDLQERERMEWGTADLILCGSEFVRDGIVASGGPAERCCVVPYGVRSTGVAPRRNFDRGPLRALTVGTVGLRKGAPYVLAAARSLKGRVEFRMAGQIGVTGYARALLSQHVTLLGAVPRSEIQLSYECADVFLLPSICEGSATVCYEALAAGLPVITTPNAGSVVRDGIDGFIVPIRDPEAIAEKLELLVRDHERLIWMSANAIARSGEYTLEKYGERLLAAITKGQPRVSAKVPSARPF